MNHSPTPWMIDKRASGHIISLSGRPIASCNGYTRNDDNGAHLHENEANTAFIINAVNCHDELLSACKEAFALLLKVGHRIETGKVINALDSAIKKAEEV